MWRMPTLISFLLFMALTMNNNFTHKIITVLIFLWVSYNGHVGAAEEERTYFHFMSKPEKDYPFEIYMRSLYMTKMLFSW